MLSIAKKALEETIEFRDLLKERIGLLDLQIQKDLENISFNKERSNEIGHQKFYADSLDAALLSLNGHKLERLRVKAELETYEKIVLNRSLYYKQFEKQFEKDLSEANANFEQLYNKARTQALKQPKLQAFLDSLKVDINEIKSNDELKVELYKRLKSEIKNG